MGKTMVDDKITPVQMAKQILEVWDKDGTTDDYFVFILHNIVTIAKELLKVHRQLEIAVHAVKVMQCSNSITYDIATQALAEIASLEHPPMPLTTTVDA